MTNTRPPDQGWRLSACTLQSEGCLRPVPLRISPDAEDSRESPRPQYAAGKHNARPKGLISENSEPLRLRQVSYSWVSFCFFPMILRGRPLIIGKMKCAHFVLKNVCVSFRQLYLLHLPRIGPGPDRGLRPG
jgi:hypothetical protein